MPEIIADLARICGDLATLIGKLPCVEKDTRKIT
jgi:hypothetical protein